MQSQPYRVVILFLLLSMVVSGLLLCEPHNKTTRPKRITSLHRTSIESTDSPYEPSAHFTRQPGTARPAWPASHKRNKQTVKTTRLTVKPDADIEREIEDADHKPDAYDQPDAAAQYYRLRRIPEGETELPVERYLVAREQMKTMRRYTTALHSLLPSESIEASPGQATEQAGIATWTPLGPTNIAGRTRALLIHPVQPDVMYAAGVTGGVWKTINGGNSWSPLTDLLPNLAVSSLAFDPANPEVIYAGTGEGVTGVFAGAGIFKSMDGGTTWQQLPGAAGTNFSFVNDIIISRHDSQRIYAATSNGIWRSTNGGVSFIRVLNPNLTGGCLDLVSRTDQTTDYLFAACGTFTQARIYRNTDAGDAGTWQEVWTESGAGRISLALAPADQNVIYAVSAEYLNLLNMHGLHSVVRSTMSGESGSWTTQVRADDANALNTVLLSNPLLAFLTDCGRGKSQLLSQGWYDNTIAVDPLDAERVWVGGIDLFRSDDGGRNWGLASYWWPEKEVPQYAHADQHIILFHPQYNGTTNQIMYVGGDGGLFRTDNARAVVATGPGAACNPASSQIRWGALNNNYSVTQFYSGAVSPDGTTWAGGTQDNGTLRGSVTTGTGGWQEILGGDGGVTAVDPLQPHIWFASTPGIGIKKSTDNGSQFSSARFGINDNGLFVTPYLLDPSDPQRMWLGGSYLWRSLNGAANWHRVGNLAGSGSDEGFSALAIAPSDANYLLAGTSRGKIIRSEQALDAQAGTFWQSVSPRFGFVSSLAFDPSNRNIAYATYSTFGGKHVWRTLDAGATWTAIDGTGSGQIPDIPVNSIMSDPANPARLFIGTDLGVFVSLDGGSSWMVENSGFANVITESLVLNTWNGQSSLYAFTHGRGVWRVPVGTGCQYQIIPGTIEVAATGDQRTIPVTVTPDDCPWTATSNADWLTIANTSGNRFTVTIAPNQASSARTGTITVGQRNLVVRQIASTDNTAPAVRILSPQESGLYRTDAMVITLSGTATDNDKITDVTWETDTKVTGTAAGTTTWTINELGLHSGINTITVKARDGSGNSSQAKLQIIQRPTSLIHTIAGNGDSGNIPDGQPARAVSLGNTITSIVADSLGNIFLVDEVGQKIRRVSIATGLTTTYAGTGSAGFSGDAGPAAQAALNSPHDAMLDQAGNLYVADTLNQRIRKITAATGLISTVAGNGAAGFGGDEGLALSAQLNRPLLVAIDRQNNLYIYDAGNNRIRRVAIGTGIITTVIGNGQTSGPLDEKAGTEAGLSTVIDMATDRAGNLWFIAQTALWKFTPDTGLVKRMSSADTTTIPGIYPRGDGGMLAQSLICSCGGMAFDNEDNLWLAQGGILRRIDAHTGRITTVAGGGQIYEVQLTNLKRIIGGEGGPATDVILQASSVTFDPAGNPLILTSQLIRRLLPLIATDTEPPVVSFDMPTGESVWETTYAGINIGGPVTDDHLVRHMYLTINGLYTSQAGASFDRWGLFINLQPGPNRLTVTAIDSFGNSSSATLTIIQTGNQQLRVLAGNQQPGFSGEQASGLTAQLWNPSALALDSAGNLYVADTGNHLVRRITRTGIISTIAGDGSLGFSGDGGQATAASLSAPRGVAIDTAGNLYIADTGNQRIRRVSPTGIITTIAGTGQEGFRGDGGPATAARLNFPAGLALDAGGNLYVADNANQRIRRIAAQTAVITTVAGGRYGYSGDDGPATDAGLNNPTGVAVDQAGNLLIADTDNHSIRKVTPAGIISTLAGNGQPGDCCSSAEFSRFTSLRTPTGVAVDLTGNIYVADAGNNLIRQITPQGDASKLNVQTGTYTETGLPVPATLKLPAAVAADQGGNLYVADSDNHRIIMLLSGDTATSVEAASYTGPTIASEAIAAAFGTDLATTTQGISSLPLPKMIGNTTVTVRDSQGSERVAPLFFVSPQQVNYQIPPGTATGPATVFIQSGSGKVSTSRIEIMAVAPGLFTADASGTGLPAAQVLRVHADGSVSYEQLARYDTAQNKFVAVPVNPGAESDQLFLVLYGTGLRQHSNQSAVAALIGDEQAEVLYAGPQGGFVGLDQINVHLPRSLSGRGDVEVKLNVAGRATNIVHLNMAGTACQNTVAATAQSFPATGGTGTGTINAANGCYWQAYSLTDWITLNAAGSGPASITFTVAANTRTGDRIGFIRAAGQVLTITQAGTINAAPPTIAIMHPSASGSYDTGHFSISLNGTATAEQGVAFLTWSNDRGESGYVSGSTDWIIIPPTLHPGLTRFTVTVTDLAGRTASATLAVSYHPESVLSTVAGGGLTFPGNNGPATSAAIDVSTFTFDTKGNLFFAGGNRVMKVDQQGVLTTFGLTGFQRSSLYQGLIIDSAGNAIVADAGFHKIRKITPAGQVTLLAGSDSTPSSGGYSGDGGPATEAVLASPFDIVFDKVGNLYIADTNNHRIRKVDAVTGIITTIAGGGPAGTANDGDGGLAVQAVLVFPSGMAFDPAGNLFVADRNGERIRKVAADTGIITTFVRNLGDPGNLNTLYTRNVHLVFDAAGNLYTPSFNRIRKITPDGIITVLAGTVQTEINIDPTPDGTPSLLARLGRTFAVRLDSTGQIYFAEGALSTSSRVRKLTPYE